MKLSVIIVNYNVKYFLAQCLHSVVRAARGIDCEIVVVDNASNDGSVEYLSELFPQVKFIKNTENVGFSKANNQALRQSKSDYVLLLNPDTIVGENSLHDCIKFMDANRKVGVTGVRMIGKNGSFAYESRRGVPDPFTAFCKISGLCTLFPNSRTFGRYYMRYLDSELPNEIEIISGAFMFIRRSALETCGYLDEEYFMYGEDIDLSYRLLRTGMKNYYIPTTILHYKGESTQRASFRYVNAFHQAMLIFVRKHFSHYSWFVSLPIHAAIYMKGFVTYVSQKLRGPIDRRMENLNYLRRSKFLVVGRGESLERMIDILKRNEIKYETIETRGKWRKKCHKVLGKEITKYDYVLYDTDAHRYSDILDAFLTSSAYGSNAPKIATYNAMIQRIIITGCMILE